MNELAKIIFAGLEGNWRFYRNFSTGDYVNGTAYFKTIQTDLLHYHEQGVLTSNCGQFTIYQDYFYYFEQTTHKIKVYFAVNEKPGGLFYELVFQPPPAENAVLGQAFALGYHLCKADHYAATYQFMTAGLFHLSYQVKGPQKDYATATEYSKML